MSNTIPLTSHQRIRYALFALLSATPFILAAVFLLASITKALDLYEFTRVIEAYTVLPAAMRRVLPVAVPIAELWLAFLLVLPGARRLAVGFTIVILFLFTAMQAWVWMNPGVPTCRCFGALANLTKSRFDTEFAIVRNVMLGGLALLYLWKVRPVDPKVLGHDATPNVDSAWARSRTAFTLVEVLVVVGVIGVLLGLSLPAVVRARESAKNIQCQNQMRAIFSAASTRAAESNGYFPLAGRVVIDKAYARPGALATALADTSRRKYSYLPDTGPHVMGIPSREFCASFAMTLLPWLGSTSHAASLISSSAGDQYLDSRFSALAVFQCPSAREDERYKAGESSSSRQIVIATPEGLGWESWWWMRTDYVLNESLLGFHTDPSLKSVRLRGNITNCRNPSQTLLLADAACQPATSVLGTWAAALNATKQTVTLADVIRRSPNTERGPRVDRVRHRNRLNICFVDGHVEHRDLNERSTQDVFLVRSAN